MSNPVCGSISPLPCNSMPETLRVSYIDLLTGRQPSSNSRQKFCTDIIFNARPAAGTAATPSKLGSEVLLPRLFYQIKASRAQFPRPRVLKISRPSPGSLWKRSSCSRIAPRKSVSRCARHWPRNKKQKAQWTVSFPCPSSAFQAERKFTCELFGRNSDGNIWNAWIRVRGKLTILFYQAPPRQWIVRDIAWYSQIRGWRLLAGMWANNYKTFSSRT